MPGESKIWGKRNSRKERFGGREIRKKKDFGEEKFEKREDWKNRIGKQKI